MFNIFKKNSFYTLAAPMLTIATLSSIIYMHQLFKGHIYPHLYKFAGLYFLPIPFEIWFIFPETWYTDYSHINEL